MQMLKHTLKIISPSRQRNKDAEAGGKRGRAKRRITDAYKECFKVQKKMMLRIGQIN